MKNMTLKEWKESLIQAISEVDEDSATVVVTGKYPGGHSVSQKSKPRRIV